MTPESGLSRCGIADCAGDALPEDPAIASAREEGEREANRRVHQIIRTFLDSRYDRLERVGLEKLVVVLRAQGVTDE